MKKILTLLFSILLITVLTGCENPSSETKVEPIVKEYEVLSVHQYVENITNGWGGIRDTNICYYFTYIDENGNIKEEKSFENLEYGLTKIVIGDTNKYVIEDRGMDTYKYLYLTKETLQNIELNSN